LRKTEHTLLCPVVEKKEGQELAAELQALGAEASFVPGDVRNEDDVRDLVDRTVARFGRLDVAVNCAELRASLAR
jgi:NAD(P)-dependent dehydrogenase (short-subunit alcohol dehydrogenase family)